MIRSLRPRHWAIDAFQHSFAGRAGALSLVVVVAASSPAAAQIRDQVLVHTIDLSVNKVRVFRFDRKLELLGSTDPYSEGVGVVEGRNQVGVDASGTSWITYDALNPTKLLRLDRDGALLPSVLLGHNPVGIAMAESGIVYAPTRIPLSATAPLYCVAPDGAVLWSSWSLAPLFTGTYPENFIAGEALWTADSTRGPSGIVIPYGIVAKLHPATGAVLGKLVLGYLAGPGLSTGVPTFVASPDGTMWACMFVAAMPFTFVQLDDLTIVKTLTIPEAALPGSLPQMRIDAAGNLVTASKYNDAGSWGSRILVFDGATGAKIADHDFGARVLGFALGPSGEDLLATTYQVTPTTFRIVRVNRVSGQRSSRILPQVLNPFIPNGDPTAFIHANVTVQAGDNDGDGATNRAETAAGSNPFDPKSRPEGPKVYLSFAPTTNSIVLVYRDPDGILHPAFGLDLASLSLVAGSYGEIFPLLLPFLTATSLSADGKEATLEFGALPIPSHLKIAMEARVKDKSGAESWDWQVTPPGELGP